MPRFSANLSTMFGEVDFPDRFQRAAAAGFKAVECQFPYAWEKEVLAGKLEQYGLEFVLHNMPPGNLAAGDRGLACLPDRVGEFQESVGLAIEYAGALKCPRLHCLSGKIPPDSSAERLLPTLVSNLRFAAAALEKENITLLVEALNSRDMPGAFLSTTRQTLRLLDEVNHPNLKLQYDIYHMQIMEGDLTLTIRENLARIGHIQLADNPGRHEPGTGEINFPNLLRAIDEMGYNGWIGCEYMPAGDTEAGLDWMNSYL